MREKRLSVGRNTKVWWRIRKRKKDSFEDDKNREALNNLLENEVIEENENIIQYNKD